MPYIFTSPLRLLPQHSHACCERACYLHASLSTCHRHRLFFRPGSPASLMLGTIVYAEWLMPDVTNPTGMHAHALGPRQAYRDDLAWAAGWLYAATREAAFLREAHALLAESRREEPERCAAPA